jgi:hypothetical protein
MPYTNSVTFLDTEGGQSVTTEVTARLWMLWTVIGSGSGTGNQQSDEGSMDGTISKGGSVPLQISFSRDADFSYASRFVGISIQDKNLVSEDKGWLFRSGSFSGPLTTEPIDIISAKKEITDAELQTMLPPLPIVIDTSTSITGLTAMLAQGGIDIVATGTTTKTGVIVGFRYTGTLVLSPSADVSGAANEAINVGILNPVLVFLPGPSVLSAIEAEILNLLRVFIMHDLSPMLRDRLEKMLNAAIAASVGRQLTGGVLPAGIILSIRTINITPDKITARASLGAFGGVMSKLPSASPTPGTTKCFIATAVYGAGSMEVQILRNYRDMYLLTNTTGRKIVSLYEFLSPNMAAFISNKPFLKLLTSALIVRPFVWIAELTSAIKNKQKKG